MRSLLLTFVGILVLVTVPVGVLFGADGGDGGVVGVVDGGGPPAVVDAAVKAAQATTQAARDPHLLTIMGAIAAGLWALLAGVRKLAPGRLSGRTIRWITLIVTPLTIWLWAWSSGMGWFDALVIASGGPNALLLNELGRAVRPDAA